MATQQELAQQMIAQLRVLDPSVSAEIGTPERKIIDTVAQALAETSIDLNLLSGSLDLDSKFGSDLDNFMAIFGFGRQQGTKATGFITFNRTTASSLDIPIPVNTQLLSPTPDDLFGTSAVFRTTTTVTLAASSLSVVAPIEAAVVGTSGNVAANTITQFYNQPILGITALTNELTMTGGLDPETDDEFKVRFKNTVFRNLSGTEDQYLALAVATNATTKANVVGPISRYREYLQVPAVDDATADPSSGLSGNGSSGQYTSALSTIPYSKHIYDSIPYFVSNGNSGLGTIFYRQDVDFTLNSDVGSKNAGDSYREYLLGSSINPVTDAPFQPNLTFYNVYIGIDEEVISVRPGDIVYFEHSYMSNVSRNDYDRNIFNCVDVFINGENLASATTVIPTPGTVNPGSSIFSTLSTDRFYFDNFRRIGEPFHRPIPGNILTPMFWQPTTDVSDTITVGDYTYYKGTHYWVVEDVSPIGGTVRARNGIEWSTSIGGQAIGDPDNGPYTGPIISLTGETSVTVGDYIFDQNIIDLQTSLEGNKQVTTDVLAHRSTKRFFKPDLTIMYTTGANVNNVNTNIKDAVSNYLDGQYFGSTIQLSDILQTVHNVAGVDNVRWSKELLDNQGILLDSSGFPRDRITECDQYGTPLLNVIVDRTTYGVSPSTDEVQNLYIAGNPTGGTFTLTINGLTTRPINYNATASTGTFTAGAWTQIQGAIVTDCLVSVTVIGSGTASSPFIVAFSNPGPQDLIVATPSMTGGSSLISGSTVFNTDFFLQDDELPILPSGITDDNGDLIFSSVIILRPRAQNTWNQL